MASREALEQRVAALERRHAAAGIPDVAEEETSRAEVGSPTVRDYSREAAASIAAAQLHGGRVTPPAAMPRAALPVVYVGMAADIVHHGHVNIIRVARMYGKVVVGLLTDEAIEIELKTYNPLVPEPGELALTMFLELTSDAELREWLPKLVGIERSLRLVLGDGHDPVVVEAEPEAAHAAALTREETTASVHYLHFRLPPDQVDALAAGPVTLELAHPEYGHATTLGDDTVHELLTDLRP